MAKRSDQIYRLAAALFLLVIAGWQVALLVIVIWSLLPQPIDWAKTWDNSEKFTGTVEHVVTVAALIVGGVWAYYRFIKGRVLIPRLELGVSGEIVRYGATKYIRVLAQLKNVGSSKVEITRRGVYLDVFAERARPAVSLTDAQKYQVRSVRWELLSSFDMLERHAWIEPGETIHDQGLVEPTTDDSKVYRIDLVIFASGTKWTATSIVGPEATHANRTARETPAQEEEQRG